ncbi:MAG: cbb3-type cytochrome c oxidase subunit 3 [Gammaproteobacteria bacterium]|nr:cbb3-type cytochrome c oxidase subunit 3 [Gammaproteobacteria bacterium]MDH5653240.1 cbb3-type cytochrome c oxidase subunit 3 [Gammaproteobacteria bacterium]
MFEWFKWFTSMENTKPFALVLFFVTFIGIVLYVYSNKQRGDRFESYKNIPFNDDEGEQSTHPEEVNK